MAFHRWMYREGRPNLLARILNRGFAVLHSLGVAPNYMVTLEVPGRVSGKLTSFPLALLARDGQRYLVAMLGNESAWIKNVRAAGGRAVLRHGRSEQVLLREVPVGLRAPILKAYLQIAPGARPHFPISLDAPLSEFEKIARDFPVFRLEQSENSPTGRY